MSRWEEMGEILLYIYKTHVKWILEIISSIIKRNETIRMFISTLAKMIM